MNTRKLNEILKEINYLISNKKFIEANELRKINNSLFKNEINFFLQGLINSENNKLEESINYFKQSIEENSEYILSYLKLADIYDKLDKLDIAEDYLKKALLINFNSDVIHNSLGYNLYKQKKIDESILSFKKAIQYNDQNYRVYFNLANSFIKKNDFNKAISYYLKTIEINKNSPEVYFYLSDAYKMIENYELAIHYLKISLQDKNTILRRDKINAKILELYLITNNQDEYEKYMQYLILHFPNNRRIAATSTFISSQFSIINRHPFCPEPLNYIYKGSLESYTDDYNLFLNSMINLINNLDFKWEPSGKTTRNGFGTTENLSEKKIPLLINFEEMILKELNKYYDQFKEDKIGYIHNWPKKMKFQSWSNRLKKQGYNITHIHPTGWISGVFYLKIPKNIVGDEAGIEFSLHGDNYFIKEKNKILNSKLQPQDGDIIFFPSSLFHRTIPFNSDEERICIAFDIFEG